MANLAIMEVDQDKNQKSESGPDTKDILVASTMESKPSDSDNLTLKPSTDEELNGAVVLTNGETTNIIHFEENSVKKMISIVSTEAAVVKDELATSSAHNQSPKVVLKCDNSEEKMVNNAGDTAIFTPRKSNLKRPKCETPELNGVLTPSKRIRIVENVDVAKGSNCMLISNECNSNSQIQVMKCADEMATVNEIEACGEKMVWLSSPSSQIDQLLINVDFVRDNLSPVKRYFSVEIDMKFVLSEAVTAMLNSKMNIAAVGPSDFHLWATRNSVLKNCSKLNFKFKDNFLKLANLDILLNNDLTLPKELTTDSSSEEIYYVGDLWNSSKGFREYILWKTSQSQKFFSTKIFAMQFAGPQTDEKSLAKKAGILFYETLPSNSVADSVDLAHVSPETVYSLGDLNEIHDILNLAVIDKYVNIIHSQTSGKGLHTLIIDNPEISFAYESCREIRFQKHFYCECLIALRSIREGGTFICKIYDSFTTFTAGLLFLLYKCFKSITIHKPASSPPCTSERFIVCKGKIQSSDTSYVVDFLLDCLDMVVNNQEQRKIVRRRVRKRLTILKMEVQTIVPLKVILSHAEFFQFLRHSNIRLSSSLVESIDSLCEDMEMEREIEINGASPNKSSEICLDDKKNQSEYLKEPVKKKIASNGNDTKAEATSLKFLLDGLRDTKLELGIDESQILHNFLIHHNIQKDGLFPKEQKISNLYPVLSTSKFGNDVLAFPILGSSNSNISKSLRGLFFGLGGTKMMHFMEDKWQPIENSNFVLPRGTIVLGEIVEEMCCSSKGFKFISTLNIFDGIYLYGTYIGSSPFSERRQMLDRFIKCLTSSSGNNYNLVTTVTLQELPRFYLSAFKKFTLLGYSATTRCYLRCGNLTEQNQHYALFDGFLFLKIMEDQYPEAFLKKYEHHIWTRGSADVDFEANLQQLETPIAVTPETCVGTAE